MTQPVSLLIVGAGDRGHMYAGCAARHPGEARVAGVAEPMEPRRARVVRDHRIPAAHVYTDWREAAREDRFADAVVICTQDRDHAAPATAFADKGYHVLLEKPMAVTPDDCRAIVDAVRRNGVLFAVGHVLRYTAYYTAMKNVIREGRLGETVSIQHLEPVVYWHQAHSYVRGNWRNTDSASFMLLTKSCHDLDLLRWLMDVPCRRVSSFGSLFHFREENRPAGAEARCTDCPVEDTCPYSAPRFYLDGLRRGHTGWPVSVVADPVSEETLRHALETGPYGRCVYACDNDVVDHQTVNLEFEGGRTAVFTMTAFAHDRAARSTRIFGTRGELIGDGRTLRLHDFLSDTETDIDPNAGGPESKSGHGGGDEGLFRAFVRAVAGKDPSPILSGPEETLESHLMVFAAEQARREGRVVDL